MDIPQDKVIKLSRIDLMKDNQNLEMEVRTSKTVISTQKSDIDRMSRAISLQAEKIETLTAQLQVCQSELASVRSSEIIALKVATDAAGLVKHHEGLVMGKDQMIDSLKDLLKSVIGKIP